MRPKVLFLLFHGFSMHNGISKKVWGQVEGLKDCGAEVKLCYHEVSADGEHRWMVDGRILVSLGTGIWGRVRKRLDFSALSRYARQERFDLVYIRSFHNANPFTIHLVQQLRAMGSKVVMEIPTYPYDQEYITGGMRRALFIDRLFRKQLTRKLHAIVTFSDHPSIFGKETIRISNGIDFGAIPSRNPLSKKGDGAGTIHLLAVAEVHYWHGFDRLIHGLGVYKQRGEGPQVIFHLVGELTGDRERSEILGAIQKYGLGKQVILHGPLWGRELDDLFDLADFAIGSLGRHRTAIDVIRTLKNREYAARGIPFIYSESDPDFDKQPYILKAPADESPILIQPIVAFVQSTFSNPKAIRKTTHSLSWSAQMQKVLSALYKNIV